LAKITGKGDRGARFIVPKNSNCIFSWQGIVIVKQRLRKIERIEID
jgi:hypothetical protein